jgi:hypothetical protein
LNPGLVSRTAPVPFRFNWFPFAFRPFRSGNLLAVLRLHGGRLTWEFTCRC